MAQINRRADVEIRGDIAEKLALAVGCSKCHAAPDQQCTTRGNVMAIVHCARLNRAVADLVNKALANE